jgi:hypothetical protein
MKHSDKLCTVKVAFDLFRPNPQSPDAEDLAWSMLGQPVISAASTIPASIYAGATGMLEGPVAPWNFTPEQIEAFQLRKKLEELAHSKGFKTVTPGTSEAVKILTEKSQDKSLPAWRRWKARIERNLAEGAPAYFDPSAGEIAMKSNIKPEIYAHELGHAVGPQWMGKPWTRYLGMLGPGYGMGLGLLSPDKDISNLWAAAGAATTLPMLASELDASWRGSKILKDLGHKGLGRFKSFLGVPTYAMATASPFLGVQAKDYFGGYD